MAPNAPLTVGVHATEMLDAAAVATPDALPSVTSPPPKTLRVDTAASAVVSTDDGEAVKAAAGALPWVDSVRDCGRFVRVEVARDRSPGPDAVGRALAGLGGGALVALAERAPADLESTLLALARRAGAR